MFVWDHVAYREQGLGGRGSVHNHCGDRSEDEPGTSGRLVHPGNRAAGPLRSEICSPWRPAFHDGQVTVGYVDLHADPVANTFRNSAATPPLDLSNVYPAAPTPFKSAARRPTRCDVDGNPHVAIGERAWLVTHSPCRNSAERACEIGEHPSKSLAIRCRPRADCFPNDLRNGPVQIVSDQSPAVGQG